MAATPARVTTAQRGVLCHAAAGRRFANSGCSANLELPFADLNAISINSHSHYAGTAAMRNAWHATATGVVDKAHAIAPSAFDLPEPPRIKLRLAEVALARLGYRSFWSWFNQADYCTGDGRRHLSKTVC